MNILQVCYFLKLNSNRIVVVGVSYSAFPLELALEACDEVSHGFISPPGLHLEVGGVLAVALLAGEESLGARLGCVLQIPVRPPRCQVLPLRLLSLHPL